MTLGIYTITAPSGAKYVGMSASGIEGRWRNHRNELKRNVHKCTGLQNAYKKYGIENLRFEIVEVLNSSSEEFILQREQHWWDKLHSQNLRLYNARPSGKGSVLHSADTREKISKAMRLLPKKDSFLHTCRKCKTSFMTGDKKEFYCAECIPLKLIRNPRERVNLKCDFCGNSFQGEPVTKYCSAICLGSSRLPKTFSLEKAKELRLQGLSLRQIGKILECSQTTVANYLKTE